MQALPVLLGSVLSRFVIEETQLNPIGRFLALTSNDEVNALATLQYQRTFSRTEVYQFAPSPRKSARQEKVSDDLKGRVLFSREITYELFEQRIGAGCIIKKTQLTADFTYQEFLKSNGAEAIPLFIRMPLGELQFFTTEFPPKPAPGDYIYSLAPSKRTPIT